MKSSGKNNKPKTKESNKKEDKNKSKTNTVENEEEEPPKKENPTNIERYIYISTYHDIKLMETLKHLFEEINQAAFNLKSPSEINTFDLTDEQKDNNEIDYISGFQILDTEIRITIIEGISNLAMKKVKSALPKTQLNTKTLKIFSDSNILYNKRIYSKFGLSLKFIKLKYKLSEILTTYTIYYNSTRYREIYDCFLNIGSILKSETMKDIVTSELFPIADSLLLVERKYGDMITEQDQTGALEVIKKKRIRIDDLISKTSGSGSGSSSGAFRILSSGNESNISNSSSEEKNKLPKIKRNAKSVAQFNKNEINEIADGKNKMVLKPKLDSKNLGYEKYLKDKKHKRISASQIFAQNINYINLLNKKPRVPKFCNYDEKGILNYKGQILFGPSRNNYYEMLVKNMREKYIKDKDHIYSYSKFGLSLNFPMLERERNEEYINYVENKSKWTSKKDFERYKQPPREQIYFPRIKQEL